jgi:D-methionine transport system substrate-binding protein
MNGGCLREYSPHTSETSLPVILRTETKHMSDTIDGAATPAPQLPPKLPEKKRNRTGWIVGIVVVAVAIIVAAVLIIVNITAPKSAEAAPIVVKIGTSDSSQPYWAILKEKALAQGIDIEPVNFSDYSQPNPALEQGQIDMNIFQHLRFLSQYNVDTGNDLEPIASTLISPLGLYSQKWKTLADIPQGGTVAIPNDPSNQSRALFVLQSAGLLKLTGDKFAPTPADIDAANSKVKVVTVDAAQTVLSMASVDGSVVNGNYVLDAKIDPKSALYADDPNAPGAQPYINLIVVRAADINNPIYQKVADLYHDPDVLNSVLAASNGTSVIVQGFDGPKLRDLLKTIEAQVTASN